MVVQDDALLKYLDDDGTTIEPEFYVPIVPLALVNAPSGIGTGWSTSVPPYNPLDIIDNIERLMDGREMKEMVPWVRGFKGTITKVDEHTFMTEGVIVPLPSGADDVASFEYLLNSPISSLTRERLERLGNDKNAKEKELKELQQTSAVSMWREDLKALRKALGKLF